MRRADVCALVGSDEHALDMASAFGTDSPSLCVAFSGVLLHARVSVLSGNCTQVLCMQTAASANDGMCASLHPLLLRKEDAVALYA